MGKNKLSWWWKPYNRMPQRTLRDNPSPLIQSSTECERYTGHYKTRVPSLKRNKRTWRNFYNLFPGLKGKTEHRGIKLRPWKEVKPK